MTLNCIWTSFSSSGYLGSVEYSFIAITPRSTLTYSGSTIEGGVWRSDTIVQSFTKDYY